MTNSTKLIVHNPRSTIGKEVRFFKILKQSLQNCYKILKSYTNISIHFTEGALVRFLKLGVDDSNVILVASQDEASARYRAS